MDLIAKLPCVAAKIYRNLYREGSGIGAIDPNLDWSHNFTNMLGYTDPQFIELMRLYLTIHRWGAALGAAGDVEEAGIWPRSQPGTCPGCSGSVTGSRQGWGGAEPSWKHCTPCPWNAWARPDALFAPVVTTREGT